MSARQIRQPVPIATTLSMQVAQKRACPQGTNATAFRCPVRHTSQQSTACVVGSCDAGLRLARDDVFDVMWWLVCRRRRLRRWTLRRSEATAKCAFRRYD